MFHDLLGAIESHQTIIIHRHSRPDGDALGSQLGLKRLIRLNFPEKNVYAVGDGAGYLSFMQDSQMDEIDDAVYEGALAIILDTSSPALISDSRYTLASATARVDHHIFQGQIAQTEVIDDSSESCCGLIALFAQECSLRLDTAAATALYTGMVTDSGRFRYDSTTPRTLRLAAFLLEHGIDTEVLFRDLYAESADKKALRSRFFLRAQFTPKNVAYIYTTRAELEELQLDAFTASRGMVNTMADLKGVDIWVNFTETEEGVLCELRSSTLNICPIAVKYGGGGHAKACGATLKNRGEAEAMLRDLDEMIGDMT